MKAYTAVWKDRHSDTTAHPFSSAHKAISWARAKATESCRFPEDYEEHDYEGSLFYADYSCESDCIYVIEAELDGEIK
tara:strand:+ start:9513 stop:9746 length:234 start_codon:yes stop_codon:yes gene_type:complete